MPHEATLWPPLLETRVSSSYSRARILALMCLGSQLSCLSLLFGWALPVELTGSHGQKFQPRVYDEQGHPP